MEAIERRGKLIAIAAIVFIIFWSQCGGVNGARNTTRMSYVCPPHFIRLGHSCYFFSEAKATWQNALFACKDRDGNLSVPARWEDRNLRKYLNKPNIAKGSRWIGGIFDYSSRAWKWGGELRQMKYQSFSKMKKMDPEQLQWHCIAMMPELMYRWSPKSCIEPRQYICQTKLQRVPRSKVKDFRRRWEKMGKINEITAPGVSREMEDPRTNDVQNANYLKLQPKTVWTRPNVKRSQVPHKNPMRLVNPKRPHSLYRSKLTPPFPGYKWNKKDPEGSYRYNEQLLRSGKTGLRPHQISMHITRLKRIRDRQLAHRNRTPKHNEAQDRPLNDSPKEPPASRVRAKTYTVENSNPHFPKMIVEEVDIVPATIYVKRHVRKVG